jgi:hypothetical protein
MFAQVAMKPSSIRSGIAINNPAIRQSGNPAIRQSTIDNR